ncbi:MAG: UDP-N-acetylmuramoyl-L-alanine--D-glutamate ligase [Clostridia bacterium]|nr:UDP-N-acetylmuramoyl-L-alanine--D-glutamate ligase [Clostridia bacterium]
MTLEEYISSFKSKRIAVIGIGISNTPLIDLLMQSGISVTLCDKRKAAAIGEPAEKFAALGAEMRLGDDYLENLNFDVIFRTPGLLPTDPNLVAAREKGAVITSEMEAFFALCPCKTIAITGSDGKTTTSSIIAELLRASGKRVHLGGNIGRPLLTDVPDMLPEDIAVLELSSFQLHSIKIRPDIAVITNVSPNHLDVHPNFEDYVFAKRSIFINQNEDDLLVVNSDNPYTAKFANECKSRVRFFSRRETLKNGVFCRDNMIYISRNFEVESIIPASEIRLPGVHNVENYMAAFAAVDGMTDWEECRNVARTYGGVAHRLELVRQLEGVSYINDSIASSPTRTIAGLRAMRQKPILIAGGHDKHIPFDKLADEISERVKALFLTGDTAGKIAEAVRKSVFYDPSKLPITIVDDLNSAILAARAMATDGDIVLLSPACSSFDRFRNFAERGDLFRNIVMGFED